MFLEVRDGTFLEVRERAIFESTICFSCNYRSQDCIYGLEISTENLNKLLHDSSERSMAFFAN